MLKDISRFENLGTPGYFYELFVTLISNREVVYTEENIKQIFSTIKKEGRPYPDGWISLATKINILHIENNAVKLNKNLFTSVVDINEFKDKFVEYLFDKLKEDEIFHYIFSSKFISYDIVYQSFQIENSAFTFRYSNFKQLLYDFGVITKHPIPEFSNFFFLINNKYKKLLYVIAVPNIRKRNMGFEDLQNALEIQLKNGVEAEKFVFEYEFIRLNKTKEIEHVAEIVVNAGYDIASYNEEKNLKYNRFIEVKSYEGDKPYFYLSRNECKVAEDKKDMYWLYLVNRSEMDKPNYSPMKIQNPYESVLLNDSWFKQIESYKIEKL